jgi:hypothetical protein
MALSIDVFLEEAGLRTRCTDLRLALARLTPEPNSDFLQQTTQHQSQFEAFISTL